ncbi:taspase, threonine aspartase, 1 [Nematocida sp. LUAm3]|nr:taspase, threonine aspartase, 1 [Nematocida sp. LUAm3]KAI5175539.1 taspase, threonine aspartase, 1 [Nematocida sp. LUAm2]KAI5178431.1 taspase, threonine aspartase, 1 [Nematocida sp. LUAm1]
MEVFAMHLGAGNCTDAKGRHLQSYLKKQLNLFIESSSSMEELLRKIEEDAECNCGAGSNRTSDGTVENEACIMQSDGVFSGVSLIPEGVSPSSVLFHSLKLPIEDNHTRPLSLVYQHSHPFWASAEKAQMYCHSDSSQESSYESASDTIGLISLQKSTITSVSSSGGPKNKPSGRIGPSSMYAANTWADSSLGLCISGTGESLIRSEILRKIKKRIQKEEFEAIKEDLKDFLEKEVFSSLGGIAIYRKSNEKVFFLHFQTSPSFVYGYAYKGKSYSFYHHQTKGSVHLSITLLE